MWWVAGAWAVDLWFSAESWPAAEVAADTGFAEDQELGSGLAIVPDFDGDGTSELVIGASASSRGGAEAGALLMVPRAALASGSTALEGDYAHLLGVGTYTGFAEHLLPLYDVDGDGLSELVIGADGEAGGAFYVLGGRLAGWEPDTSRADLAAIVPVTTLDGAANLGQALAACDLDADGLGDLVVSASQIDHGADAEAGALFLFNDLAGVLATDAPRVLDSDWVPAARVYGDAADRLGPELSCGVGLTGPEPYVLATSGLCQGCGRSEGYVAWWEGVPPTDALVDATRVWTVDLADVEPDESRLVVGPLGDLDGDGLLDLVVGVPGYRGAECSLGTAGLVAVRYGAIDLASPGAPALIDDADAWICGRWSNGMLGRALTAAGDVNGDGTADLVVGAVNTDADVDQDRCGRVQVLYGGGRLAGGYDDALAEVFDHTISLFDEDSGTCSAQDSTVKGRYFGRALAVGDLDGDPWADIAIGAQRYDGKRGRVWVLHGGPDLDRDGYFAAWAGGEDCDDDDADTAPRAAEHDGDGIDHDCDGYDGVGPGSGSDADGDGLDAGVDCDDAQIRATAPGAAEEADGVDNNCDGIIDEGTTAEDRDGDGLSAAQGDCDDGLPAIGLGAPEVADGLDNDCDGRVDELCANTDDDGDGYSEDDGDCDDTDARISPGVVETCDGVDQDCDGVVDPPDSVDATVCYADIDGDGVGGSAVTACVCGSAESEAGGDCDDTDAAVLPGAEETCDARDQDCDGLVDEDAVDPATWYVDTDGDGYGNLSFPYFACDAAAGTVARSDDCDDAAADVYPDGIEVCDGRDQDCDGGVDEDAIDAPTWYEDVDGDGAGDPALGVMGCAAPAGYVAAAGDCDPSDSAVSPVAFELCDGRDNDCDGTVDLGALDALTFYEDHDGDGFGDPARSAAACAAPSGSVSDATDCDDDDVTAYPGGEERCDSVDQDCDALVDEGAVDALLSYDDLDGDGAGDSASEQQICDISGRVLTAGDCDDDDASRAPGAVEVCDEVDQDCDGVVDEDAVDTVATYTDVDGDGDGAGAPIYACTLPEGAALTASDCDDGDPEVFPGSAERCDSRDQDCDGMIDEDAVDATAWYLDGDGDGEGAGAPVLACDAPDGAVATADDCDDADPGLTRPCLYPDMDHDVFGAADSRCASTCPGEGWADNAEDCDDGDASVHPDMTEGFDGVDRDCDQKPGDASVGCGCGLADGDSGWGLGGVVAALLRRRRRPAVPQAPSQAVTSGARRSVRLARGGWPSPH